MVPGPSRQDVIEGERTRPLEHQRGKSGEIQETHFIPDWPEGGS
jgi:hypothetical protein